MSNVDEIERISRSARSMDLGNKIAGVIKLANKLRHLALYHCVSPAGLAIGTSDPAKVKIVNTTQYVQNGVIKSKTTAEVAFTATSHDIAPHASLVKEACYTVYLDAGTPGIAMGQIVIGSGNAIAVDAPAGSTEIGVVRVAVDAGATPFDASTTQLDDGALTVTYEDRYGIPLNFGDAVAELTE